MVFSSLSFLIVFLPVLTAIFFLIPAERKNARQYVLLLFSLIFYGLGEPLYIFLILTCILVSRFLSRYVEKHLKWALVLVVLINVLPLVITKYLGFIITNICVLLRISDFSIPEISMPVGISFYTFQMIAYMADLYNGKADRVKDPLLFALYVMFFPQLVAGPIVKYSEISAQLEKPDVSWDNIRCGTGRFIAGLGKKVLIADRAGFIASSIRDCSADSLTPGMTWLCVFAYTVQIFFDFSGYSDMAIGLGRIFGFHLPENFDDPYTSCSVSEFWKRWHITLGRFFREYVYIPLGGNRAGKPRWLLNMFIVWVLTGLWHGASWNFVIWGLYYCLLIVIEKMTGLDKKMPRALSWLFTMILVTFGWGIFLCDDMGLHGMANFLAKLFFAGGPVSHPVSIGSLRLWGYIPFLIAGAFLSSPLWISVVKKLKKRTIPFAPVAGDVCLILILIVSLMFLIGGTYDPFIYFRF